MAKIAPVSSWLGWILQ